MARSSGSIHVADNSVTSINDALQQILFMLDELRGEHNTTTIVIGAHSHATGSGGQISHDTGLTDVSANDHHNQLHAAEHGPGATDPLKIDDLAAADDNTDLNVSVTTHGLTPKLPNDSTKFLDGAGQWSTVVATATEANDVAMSEAQLSEERWEQNFVAGCEAFDKQIFIRKVLDESISNNTLQDDNDLFFDVGANEWWEFTLFLAITSTSETPDIKIAMIGPSGMTGWWGGLGAHVTSALGSRQLGSNAQSVWDGSIPQQFGTFNGSGTAIVMGLAKNGSTAGTLKLQWAQQTTTGGNPTIIEADSYIVARRVS